MQPTRSDQEPSGTVPILIAVVAAIAAIIGGILIGVVTANSGDSADDAVAVPTPRPTAEATATPTPRPSPTATPTPLPSPTPVPEGFVVVRPGESIQIRSLNSLTGPVAFLGQPIQSGIEQAIIDYGPIRGFDVDMGAALDDMCSDVGGEVAAQTIAAEPNVIGVIGTTCSSAAIAAGPIIGDAGMVMISPANTSPVLTSDLRGDAGAFFQEGYYRISHNDLSQGFAMAEFVLFELGRTRAAAIHDGDPYTESLATAFATRFEELGGIVTGLVAVDPGTNDLRPVLDQLAADVPLALFVPAFPPLGERIIEQASSLASFDNVRLVAADNLLADSFLTQSISGGVHLSAPDFRYGSSRNQSTGVTADEFRIAYRARYGETPQTPYWAHAYDATAILLDAIEAASEVGADGTLVIDRAAIRTYLDGLRDYEGLTGTLTCDAFGDCGSQRMEVIRVDAVGNVTATRNNVVFEYSPSPPDPPGA